MQYYTKILKENKRFFPTVDELYDSQLIVLKAVESTYCKCKGMLVPGTCNIMINTTLRLPSLATDQ